ncbi:MAG TPA: excinuclease ABC subunit UvrC, partial [Candidatus Limnocylindria bacterium]|nr:excinuclease ABC subunit UvrC [Candidatus Limnocylindria bacterium]
EVHAYKGDDFDVLAASLSENDAVVQLFRVRDGTVVGRDHFAMEGSEGASPGEVVASFLRLHYAAAGTLPPEVVTPSPLPDGEALETFLAERRGGPARIHVPQRGRKRHLAELAERNAADALAQERVRWLADRGKTDTALKELQDALGLEGPPKRIECYDVSHVQGTSVVSSMVVFEDGRPAKSQYRRFRARIGDRNDDFANMRETLRRRFSRSAQGDETTGTAWALPDLVILDGGKGQLSAGLDALADAGRLQIPIVALAKEREELFLPGRPDPVVLPRTSQGLYLVQRIRDEAHRFAVTYHQKVRSKRAVRSLLDDVAGVGPAKKRALLRKFGSVRGMREAGLDDLAAVAGVGSALAKRIKDALDS